MELERHSRRHEDVPDDQRSWFERDRDRILYSSHFRRLAGITQVISPNQLHVVHNRLTHSLEVAQIARRLAQYIIRESEESGILDSLGGLDPDVVETAALAHDLGHPPFGHVAETELKELSIDHKPAKLEEGFNGNAQSFRILTKLSVRRDAFPGLNLTRAGLNAVQKYPFARGTSGESADHWGYYSTEAEDFMWARANEASKFRSLEADIIDWADDVAYAVHDLEDFIRVGLIPIDRLTSESTDDEPQRFIEMNLAKFQAKGISEDEVREAYQEVFGVLTVTSIYRGLRSDRSDLRRSTSNLIGRFIGDLKLNEDWKAQSPRSTIVPKTRNQVELLKRLTWFYVIDNPSLAMQQEGHRQIVRFLFNAFIDAAFSGERRWKVFPEAYRERLQGIQDENVSLSLDLGLSKPEQKVRPVVDFISSMTEPQATEIFTRLSGLSARSALEAVTV